jgi:hypothetical protein
LISLLIWRKHQKQIFQPDLRFADLAVGIYPYRHFVDMGIFVKMGAGKLMI